MSASTKPVRMRVGVCAGLTATPRQESQDASFATKEGILVDLRPNTVRLLPDGWTVVTKDQSLSAQWEHTILVTDVGYEVLTLGAAAAQTATAAVS